MNILPKISSVDVFNIKENQNSYTYINLNKDDNSWITFKDTNKSDNNILKDLIENKAYATMLLYLNENYILQVGMTNDIFKKSNSSISDYLKECENLLYKNTKIVEEAGIPLCNINGYKIFEGAGYILRGNGKKKIKESFKEGVNWEEETLDLFPAIKSEVIKMIDNNTNKWDIFDFIDSQVRVYSISKEEGNELKKLINNDLQEDTETFIEQLNKDLSNKSSISDILRYYNNMLEDSEDEEQQKAIQSIIARLDILKSSLNESENELSEKILNIIKRHWKMGDAKINAINSIYYLIHKGWEDELVFSQDEEDLKKAEELYDKYLNIYLDNLKEAEGTQCSDIAPKTDQGMNKRTTNKKKYYDILLSDFSESDNMNIINKGFLKNSEGQYQRGNYILVKEGETYLAIHKDKLKEDIK